MKSNSMLKRMQKGLKRHITVMFIPHSIAKPLRLSFSVSFIVFMLFMWSGLTVWAGYIAGRHIDYWRIRADYRLMKLKVQFFANQVKKSREVLEEVRTNDEQLRSLLKLKSRKAIIEKEGKGGPTTEEISDLMRLLSGRIHEMSQQDIYRQTSSLFDETNEQIDSYKEIFSYVEDNRAIYRATPNIMPAIGTITSPFGYRFHPIHKVYENHTGIDIANVKNTPIYATAYGKVRLCDWQPGYGRIIIIDHGYAYQTYYAHLEKILVKDGDYIHRGQLIALMGETGTSTGSHIHYEVRYKNKIQNPKKYFDKKLSEIVHSAISSNQTLGKR